MSEGEKRWRPRLLAWLLARGGRHAGFLLAAAIALLQFATDVPPEDMFRNALFDTLQKVFPRERANDPVVVIDIDDRSLIEMGDWPWPRSAMAALVERIQQQRPAALGIDIVFAAPDRYSPRALRAAGVVPPGVELPQMPDYDARLAQAISRMPVTLGVGGLTGEPNNAVAPGPRAPILQAGGDAAAFVPSYEAALRSIAVIDQAANGHGVINKLHERDGIVRRMPALIAIDGALMPGFAIDLMRLVQGEPVLRVVADVRGVHRIDVGELTVNTDADGGWWLHYSDPDLRPRFSAAALMRGEFSASLMTGRVVLLGVSAADVGDSIATPQGMMAGVEAHAEAIENMLDLQLLTRPGFAPYLEASLLGAFALLLVLAVPALRPAQSLLVLVGCAVLAVGICALAFTQLGWLIDIGNPLFGASLVFAFMLLLTLGTAQTQRQSLRSALQNSREERARLDGELDAARRIQTGMLPIAADVVGSDARVALAAYMQPARTIGGDLYDFFRIDDARLFFVVGDVSGKGLPASLFMALSKSLIKGAALRNGTDPGRCLADAAAVMARENPEAMFVSVVAGLLDLDSGKLAWSVAGHDAPYLICADDGEVRALHSDGGPALCVVDGYDYPTERTRLLAGDSLCLYTDGVTDAQSRSGELYGNARLAARLRRLDTDDVDDLLDKVRADVLGFTRGRELGDDLTLLILRWRGPTTV